MSALEPVGSAKAKQNDENMLIFIFFLWLLDYYPVSFPLLTSHTPPTAGKQPTNQPMDLKRKKSSFLKLCVLVCLKLIWTSEPMAFRHALP